MGLILIFAAFIAVLGVGIVVTYDAYQGRKERKRAARYKEGDAVRYRE